MKKRRILCVFTALFLLFTYCAGSITEVSAASVKESGGFRYRYDKASGGIKLLKYTGKGKKVTVPKKIGGKRVTAIGGCFVKNKKITEVTLPDTVKTMDTGVFFDCKSLKKVTLPKNLKTLPAWTFYECHKLKSVNLPSKLERIGAHAFSECYSLSKITLPSKLKVIETQAFEFSGIKKLTLPASVTKLESNVFLESDIHELKIPKNSKLKEIGGGIFQGCEFIDTITVPASVKTLGYGAFSECSLRQVTFAPNSKITKIPDDCFGDCISLEVVDIPENVTSIGKRVFLGADDPSKNVRQINFLGGKVQTFDEQSFDGLNKYVVITVPSEYKTEYEELFKKQSWYQSTMTIKERN